MGRLLDRDESRIQVGVYGMGINASSIMLQVNHTAGDRQARI